VSEAQSDPELATAFRERWLMPRRKGVQKTMLQAISEGSLRDDFDIETAMDLLYGSIYYRLLLGTGPLDASFIENTYRQFLAGHGTHSSSSRAKMRRDRTAKLTSVLP